MAKAVIIGGECTFSHGSDPDFTVVNRKSGDSHPLHDREKQGLAAAGGAVGRSRLLGKCG